MRTWKATQTRQLPASCAALATGRHGSIRLEGGSELSYRTGRWRS